MHGLMFVHRLQCPLCALTCSSFVGFWFVFDTLFFHPLVIYGEVFHCYLHPQVIYGEVFHGYLHPQLLVWEWWSKVLVVVVVVESCSCSRLLKVTGAYDDSVQVSALNTFCLIGVSLFSTKASFKFNPSILLSSSGEESTWSWQLPATIWKKRQNFIHGSLNIN